MKEKDLIIRISGSNAETEKLIEEIISETKALGLLPENKSIKAVPNKVRKKELQNKKAKDLQISALGQEDKIESFIDSVIDAVDSELELPQPSISLKLDGGSEDEQE